MKVMMNVQRVLVAVRSGEPDSGIDESLQADEEAPGNMGVLKGEPARFMKSNQGVVATRTVGTGVGALMTDSMDDNDIAVTRSTSNPKPPAASTNEKLATITPVANISGPGTLSVLPPYPVGRGIFLPFNQTLPKCEMCRCTSALITRTRRSDPCNTVFLCLGHGLDVTSATHDLVLCQLTKKYLYSFISPQHEAAIRAVLA